MRLYLDTAAVIYYVEQISPWFTAIQSRLAPFPDRPIISDLTRMECLIKPLRTGDHILLLEFQTFFSKCEILSLPAAVFDRAAMIRATHGFETADSIHLAAAVLGTCDEFLINDHQLTRFPDINVALI